MKAINYKMNKFVFFFRTRCFLPKETSDTCIDPEYILGLQKERKIWQKSKTNILFCEKAVSKPVK